MPRNKMQWPKNQDGLKRAGFAVEAVIKKPFQYMFNMSLHTERRRRKKGLLWWIIRIHPKRCGWHVKVAFFLCFVSLFWQSRVIKFSLFFCLYKLLFPHPLNPSLLSRSFCLIGQEHKRATVALPSAFLLVERWRCFFFSASQKLQSLSFLC